MTNEQLKSEDGVKEITTALDRLFGESQSETAYAAFENFIKFQRPDSMPINDYIIEFNLRLGENQNS